MKAFINIQRNWHREWLLWMENHPRFLSNPSCPVFSYRPSIRLIRVPSVLPRCITSTIMFRCSSELRSRLIIACYCWYGVSMSHIPGVCHHCPDTTSDCMVISLKLSATVLPLRDSSLRAWLNNEWNPVDNGEDSSVFFIRNLRWALWKSSKYFAMQSLRYNGPTPRRLMLLTSSVSQGVLWISHVSTMSASSISFARQRPTSLGRVKWSSPTAHVSKVVAMTKAR